MAANVVHGSERVKADVFDLFLLNMNWVSLQLTMNSPGPQSPAAFQFPRYPSRQVQTLNCFIMKLSRRIEKNREPLNLISNQVILKSKIPFIRKVCNLLEEDTWNSNTSRGKGYLQKPVWLYFKFNSAMQIAFLISS